MLTAVGRLEIVDVRPITRDQISDADARRAGYGTRTALLEELDSRTQGDIYRIELGGLSPDPRSALREDVPADADALDELARRLERLDARAPKRWTRRVLELIAAHPDTRAADLCGRVGQEKEAFKVNVRKLKKLGLTESRETGYRLSPRRRALLEHLQR